MYSQEDLLRAKAGMKKMYIINAVILLVTLVIAVVGLIIRQEWLVMAGFAVTLCLSYGFFVLKTRPWHSYYKFVKDLLEGRSRDTEGVFLECSDEVRVADGVQVHDFMIEAEDSEEPLLYYWDDDKPIPSLKAGDRVRVTSFGRFVRALSMVTEG